MIADRLQRRGTPRLLGERILGDAAAPHPNTGSSLSRPAACPPSAQPRVGIEGRRLARGTTFAWTMAAVSTLFQPAAAADKIKIGLIYTLSGPAAVLGQQSRDGFALAIKELGGRMAGREVEVIVADDELKPDVAVQKVKGFLDRDKIDFVVGAIFSNVLQAIHNPVIESGRFLIGSNSGPSLYAGKGCSPNFFVTSYQNDVAFEALGKVAQDSGYKRMYLMVPNYQAGKDGTAEHARFSGRACAIGLQQRGRAVHVHARRNGD